MENPLLNPAPPQASLVVLSSDEQYALRISNRLSGNNLFQVEYIKSLNNLLAHLHKHPVDVVIAEIHANQADSLMLPCWISDLNSSSQLRRVPHIVWTVQTSTPAEAISLATDIEHGRIDAINGISCTALTSHVSLARASGIEVEITAENHTGQLLQILEKIACTEHFPPLRSQSDELELSLSEDEVVSALTTGDGLRVVLQPQYDLASRQVVGAEALIRWRHPHHDDIPLSILIPMVERLGLDLLLFSYIERTVIETLATLDCMGIDIPISINASARTLCAAGLAARLTAQMRKAGLPARRLKIELTEPITAANELALSAAIMALRAKGFLISLNDFGAGAATQALLAHIPFDEMKIDGRLALAVGQYPESSEIISGIACLARHLNLNLVTESIEDAPSVELLNRLGCRTGQGFALAHPLEQEDFLDLVRHSA
ncbi:TPA: EAL domain-containing protein [Pseudomonas aeruginosa]|nr:EAL domain-containing protein [Pseudomonas aeruginosa]